MAFRGEHPNSIHKAGLKISPIMQEQQDAVSKSEPSKMAYDRLKDDLTLTHIGAGSPPPIDACPPEIRTTILRLSRADHLPPLHPVPLSLADADKPRSTAVCSAHSLETCATCNLDFPPLNALAKMFSLAPTDAILPQPNVVQSGRAQAVSKTKDDGNTLYKRGMPVQAINAYTTAMQISSSKPRWEASALAKEELAFVVCNRSAAFYAAGDPLSSLIDAEVVIGLKRPWVKGHYRKGRALLKLGDVQGARDAAMLGLQFEPTNVDLEVFSKSKEVDHAQEKLDNTLAPAKPFET